MDKIIEILNRSIRGELIAKRKYELFSDIATKEDLFTIAILFKAVSYAESIHVKNHSVMLTNLTKEKVDINKYFKDLDFGFQDQIKSTRVNLLNSQVSENFEYEDKYKNFKVLAKKYGYPELETHFSLIRLSEKSHADLFSYFIKRLIDEDFEDSITFHVCRNYGNIILNEVPDTCPLCGKAKDVYIDISI